MNMKKEERKSGNGGGDFIYDLFTYRWESACFLFPYQMIQEGWVGAEASRSATWKEHAKIQQEPSNNPTSSMRL